MIMKSPEIELAYCMTLHSSFEGWDPLFTRQERRIFARLYGPCIGSWLFARPTVYMLKSLENLTWNAQALFQAKGSCINFTISIAPAYLKRDTPPGTGASQGMAPRLKLRVARHGAARINSMGSLIPCWTAMQFLTASTMYHLNCLFHPFSPSQDIYNKKVCLQNSPNLQKRSRLITLMFSGTSTLQLLHRLLFPGAQPGLQPTGADLSIDFLTMNELKVERLKPEHWKRLLHLSASQHTTAFEQDTILASLAWRLRFVERWHTGSGLVDSWAGGAWCEKRGAPGFCWSPDPMCTVGGTPSLVVFFFSISAAGPPIFGGIRMRRGQSTALKDGSVTC